MHIHHLLNTNSIASKFIAQLRDTELQKDRMRFRRNIERIGEILSYELSKKIKYKEIEVASPLGESTMYVPDADLVICSILRAGLPLHNGILNYFDDAASSFISAYRHHPNNDEQFEIKVEYLASPSIDNKILILADPMLATGSSFINVLESLKKIGTPKEIHLVAVIGTEDGIKAMDDAFPQNTHLWIAAIDKELDDRGYIVPGLGDAGDLAYGNKLQH